MGDILEKKTLDYFYTYPISTRRYTTLYVNDGKIYQTKCKDDISKITIVDENQNPQRTRRVLGVCMDTIFGK